MIKRNNYKQISILKKMDKKGQVAIYIIIAIIIVVLGLMAYFFRSDISTFFGAELIPNNFIATCIDEEVKQGILTLSMQGGYLNPEGFIMYQGRNIKYLCYNSQYYTPCQVQQPLIKAHFEQELNSIIEEKAEQCAIEMRREYESRGYSVTGTREINSEIEILPGRIRLNLNAPMTVTKDVTQTFTEFNIEYRSEMYGLLMIATSLIDYESTYGDTDTDIYFDYYPNLKIRKTKLGDGSTIYTVEDIRTGEEFTFASRSLAWPGGFGYVA